MAFLDPDPEIQMLREDLTWPPRLDSHGDLDGVRGVENLEAAVVSRAATRRGEIIHREAYGLDLDDELGGPDFDEDLAVLQARLLEQYGRETRLADVDVLVERDESNDGDTVATVRGTAKTGAEIGATIPMEA